MTDILPIDLNFGNHSEVISVFLVPYVGGALLVETGPASTLEALLDGLRRHGVGPEAVTHVLITHIHLDHAGAAGWFAQRGARVLVHPLGLPHLAHPEKLLASARRIYGERMETLWGRFEPVPEACLSAVADGEQLSIGGLRLSVLHTPGHAKHHVCYLLGETAFTGDVGGVRMPGAAAVRLPFVPPETDLVLWRRSLERLRRAGFGRIAITHSGLFDDAPVHLERGLRMLDAVEAWLGPAMADDPTVDTLFERYSAWLTRREVDEGVRSAQAVGYEESGPLHMAASGLHRYWHTLCKPA